MITGWTDVAQTIATVVGVCIALVGVPIFIHQVRQLERSIRGDTHEKLYAHSAILMQLVFDNPELRPFVWGNVEIPADHPLTPRAQTLVEMYAQFVEHIVLQRPNMPPDLWPPWSKYVDAILETSPSLRKYIRTWAPTFSPLLVERLEPFRADED